MFAIIIITAFTVVFTVFNYDSFMPAVHQMSQSLYENTLHRWHVPPSIGANTTNLNQVVQTFNDSSANANHSLSGTAATITFNIETVQVTASTNKLYEIEVNKADFDKCSKATIDFNDIVQTSNNVNNELIPEVIPKSREVVKNEAVIEKKPVIRKSKNGSGKQFQSPFTVNMSSVSVAVVLAIIGVDLFGRYGPDKKSTPTKALEEESIEEVKSIVEEESIEEKSIAEEKFIEEVMSTEVKSTEEEKKPFDLQQQHAQEMYPHIDTTTSNENSPLECLSTPPSDTSCALSLKEAPATLISGFVEPELPRVHLSDHASSIGLVDGSQHSTHSLRGEEDVYKAGPVTPANALVEVTTDSTETPEDKSNCAQAEPAITAVEASALIEPLEDTSNEQAEPAITAIEKKPTTHSEPVDLADEMPEEKPIHATHSATANLTDEVKADSIELVERRRHSQSISSDESTNFTNENSGETNSLVEEVEPKESEEAKKNNDLSDSFDLIHIRIPKAVKWAKLRKRHHEYLKLYHKRDNEVIDYSKMVMTSTYEDLKTGEIHDSIINYLEQLERSVTDWTCMKHLSKMSMVRIQENFIKFVKNKKILPDYLSKRSDYFYDLVQLCSVLLKDIKFVQAVLETIRNSTYSHTSPPATTDVYHLSISLNNIHKEVKQFNTEEHYRYRDCIQILEQLL